LMESSGILSSSQAWCRSIASTKNDKFCVEELAHDVSISDEPVSDELDSTPDLGNAEGLTIEEFTSLRAEE
jgi:hypothetical protein